MSTTPSASLTAYDLLAHEPFVRSIARSLLADEHRVGDVIQETWVRALAKPPAKASSLRAWLGQVTRRLAMDQYRRDANRRFREQRASRSESVEGDKQDLEMHGQVVQAVLSLPDLYRPVVMLHYYRGMSLAATARELDRNQATVRSQLQRAHAMLRAQLDKEHGGDRQAWMAIIAPLAMTPSFVRAAGPPMLATAALILVGGFAVLQLTKQEDPSELFHPRGDLVSHTLLGGSLPDSSTTDKQLPTESAALGSDRQVMNSLRAVTISFRGEPVNGAVVWCLTANDIGEDATKKDPGIQYDPERLFPKFGTRSKSNQNGVALIRDVEEDFALFVTDESGMRLLTFAQTRADRIDIELEAVTQVSVLAVNSQGVAMPDIPIVLDVTMGDASSAGIGIRNLYARTHLTGHGAEPARFRGFDETTHGVGTRSWRVGLGIPGVLDRQQSFDLSKAGADPIVLEVGALGALEVLVLDRFGDPLAAAGHVQVSSANSYSAPETHALENGRVRFPRVGVGNQMQLRVTVPELGAVWRQVITGPVSPGDTGHVVIRQPSSPALRGQVLNLDGQPLTNASLDLTLVGDEAATLMSVTVLTDPEGFFLAELTLPWPAKSARAYLFHRTSKGIQSRAQSQPFKPSEGAGDMGVLRLIEAKGWIEGRCVSADGSPIQGIRLSAAGLPGFGKAMALTDVEGNFQMGGVLPQEPMIQIEDGNGWLLVATPIASLGQEDLQIQMVRGASIEGTIVADAGVSLHQFELSLAPEEGSLTTSDTEHPRLAFDPVSGRFNFDGLPPRNYALAVSLHGHQILRLTDLHVDAGHGFSDARVRSIDLRGLIGHVDLRVSDRNGLPIPAAGSQAQLIANGKVMAKSPFQPDGRVLLTHAKSEGGVLVLEATGYRSVVIETSEALDEVRLGPGIPVTLKTTPRKGQPLGSRFFPLSLYRIEEDSRLGVFRRRVQLPSSFTSSGIATLHFPAPGRYQLFYLSHSRRSPHGVLDFGPPQPVPGNYIIDIPDGTSRLELELPLPDKLAD